MTPFGGWLVPKLRLIDAKGRTVLPGLIDAHTHPHLWGMMHLGFKYDPQLQWLYVEGKESERSEEQAWRVNQQAHSAGRARQVGDHLDLSPALQQAIAGRGNHPGRIWTRSLLTLR